MKFYGMVFFERMIYVEKRFVSPYRQERFLGATGIGIDTLTKVLSA
jgi:hypothetical protein